MNDYNYLVVEGFRLDGTPYWIAEERRTTGSLAAGPYLTPQEADAWIERKKKENLNKGDFSIDSAKLNS